MVLGNSDVDVVVATSNRYVSFVDDCDTNAMDILLSTKFQDIYIPICAAIPPIPRLTTHSCSNV